MVGSFNCHQGRCGRIACLGGEFVEVTNRCSGAAWTSLGSYWVTSSLDLDSKTFFSRIRYGVIRPCGPNANVNPLEDCKPASGVLLTARRNTDGTVRISWPLTAAGFTLQENPDSSNPTGWIANSTMPMVVAQENVVTVTPTGTRYFRLISP